MRTRWRVRFAEARLSDGGKEIDDLRIKYASYRAEYEMELPIPWSAIEANPHRIWVDLYVEDSYARWNIRSPQQAHWLWVSCWPFHMKYTPYPVSDKLCISLVDGAYLYTVRDVPVMRIAPSEYGIRLGMLTDGIQQLVLPASAKEVTG